MKKILFLGIVAVLILLTPFGVKKYVENSLEKTKNDLNNVGLEFNVVSDEGYFESNRVYELKINNIVRLQKYIKEELYKVDPTVEKYIKNFDISKEENIEQIKNIILKGKIKNSNILPFSKIHSTMYLASLPKVMMRDKKVNDFIKNKSIFLNLTTSFLGKLEKIDLKDIKIDNQTILSGTSFINKASEKYFAGNLLVDNIGFASKYSKKDRVSIDKIDYDFTYTNYWTNSIKAKINAAVVSDVLKMKELVHAAYGKIEGDDYLGGMDLNIKKLYLKPRRGFALDISNLAFKMDMKVNQEYLKNMNKIYYQSLMYRLFGIGSYSNQALVRSMLRDPEVMIKGLNHGLTFKSNLTFDEFKFSNISVTNPKLDISIKLDKNDLNASTLSKDLLKFLNLNLNLKIKENEYKNLAAFFRLKKLNEYVKFENKQAIIKVETLNNQINVNGKVLTF